MVEEVHEREIKIRVMRSWRNYAQKVSERKGDKRVVEVKGKQREGLVEAWEEEEECSKRLGCLSLLYVVGLSWAF